MLIIRQAQMDALTGAMTRNFENRMLAHFAKRYPQRTRRIGEAALQRAILSGIEQARRYELTTEGGIYVYLSLLFILGDRFGEDPQLPWAQKILTDASTNGAPRIRMERLHQAGTRYLEQTFGARHELLEQATRRISGQQLQSFLQIPGDNLRQEIHQLLQHIYPEKAAALDSAALKAFIRLGADGAKRHRISDRPTALRYLLLMLLLGSYFDGSPLFPWTTDGEAREGQALVQYFHEQALVEPAELRPLAAQP